MARYRRCPDCDGGFMSGDGKCSRCHGSGVNLQLDSDVQDCAHCGGSGICPTCKGTGTNQPDEITSLFS